MQSNSSNAVETKEIVSNWKLFGGVASGFGLAAGQDYAGSPSGLQVVLSGLVSYEARSWVYDGGISWLYSQLNGSTAENLPVEVRTRAGMINLSPRYRLSQHWQLGPAMDIAFGTDTSFGASVGNPIGTCVDGTKSCISN